MQLLPNATSVGDLCTAAMKECGALGVGQTPLAEDAQDAWARLQWMLQQWERKRWLVYHLVDLSIVSTGAISYTMGPGAQLDTGAGSARPAKIESAFLRNIQNSEPNQVDYPLEILQSREDYNRIALKTLKAWPGYVFYDSDWPAGNVFVWPVPNATIYEVHVSVMAQLPVSFPTLATNFSLPYEYYNAIVLNLALRLRPKYGITSPPGDQLPALAKDALNVLRTANVQIGRLDIPADLLRQGIYNIFSDRMY